MRQSHYPAMKSAHSFHLWTFDTDTSPTASSNSFDGKLPTSQSNHTVIHPNLPSRAIKAVGLRADKIPQPRHFNVVYEILLRAVI